MEKAFVTNEYEAPSVKVHVISTKRIICSSPAEPKPGEGESVGYDDWGI